ncbi:MAG: pyridoxamine 5'-phosphate oxidase family protein [Gemmatimonadota bacterium]|nr:MAG: pyridoxamine 5'-phosphate oxidase family protein [Gemmatimonadota bacterium]
MNSIDEPIFGPEFGHGGFETSEEPDVEHSIRDLLAHQSFCVLCTQGQSQPYGSLIAFAFTDNLKTFFFTTPLATRKFKLLSECNRIALVIDSRCQHPDDMTKVGAVTVTGKAERLQSGEEFEQGIALLKSRHPYLAHFLESDSTALFKVDVVRYFHVTRFQEVSQWIP